MSAAAPTMVGFRIQGMGLVFSQGCPSAPACIGCLESFVCLLCTAMGVYRAALDGLPAHAAGKLWPLLLMARRTKRLQEHSLSMWVWKPGSFLSTGFAFHCPAECGSTMGLQLLLSIQMSACGDAAALAQGTMSAT